MKKFLRKMLYFILPLFFLMLFPIVVLFVSGELLLPSQVVKLQSLPSEWVLYGPGYSGYIKSLKVEGTVFIKPEVLALGNSRILQIRKEFFNPGVKFYNAGTAVVHLQDFRKFLAKIPAGDEPKVLLIDVEQSMFNSENYSVADDGAENEFKHLTLLDSSANVIITSWVKVYTDYFKGKYTLSQVFKKQDPGTKLIGMGALVELNGWRNDGSYYYGKFIHNPNSPSNPDYQFSATNQYIANGVGSFAYGQNISEQAIVELDKLLEECRRRNIYVIGYFPPFPHAVYSLMKTSGKFSYMFDLPVRAKLLFDKYNFEFYDFSDLAQLGASDIEAVDGQHASEKSYVRLVLEMIKHGSKLSQYVNKQLLMDKLVKSKSDYYVFPK